MPRVAEQRPAAEPRSPQQHARHSAILRAAAHLGAEHDLEHVQMHDVAKEAGVAIATVYRYFPSKTHLFTAVLSAQVEHMDDPLPTVGAGGDPVEGVAETLLRSTRYMLRTPRLTHAMLQSNNDAHTATITESASADTKVQETLLRVLNLDEPTEQDNQLLGLLMKCWHGVLVSAINGHTTEADAETQIRLACEVLLARLSNLG